MTFLNKTCNIITFAVFIRNVDLQKKERTTSLNTLNSTNKCSRLFFLCQPCPQRLGHWLQHNQTPRCCFFQTWAKGALLAHLFIPLQKEKRKGKKSLSTSKLSLTNKLLWITCFLCRRHPSPLYTFDIGCRRRAQGALACTGFSSFFLRIGNKRKTPPTPPPKKVSKPPKQ